MSSTVFSVYDECFRFVSGASGLITLTLFTDGDILCYASAYATPLSSIHNVNDLKIMMCLVTCARNYFLMTHGSTDQTIFADTLAFL